MYKQSAERKDLYITFNTLPIFTTPFVFWTIYSCVSIRDFRLNSDSAFKQPNSQILIRLLNLAITDLLAKPVILWFAVKATQIANDPAIYCLVTSLNWSLFL